MVVKVPLPVWTLKPEPDLVETQVAQDVVADEIPLLEAADEPFPFPTPVYSSSLAASRRRTTSASSA